MRKTLQSICFHALFLLSGSLTLLSAGTLAQSQATTTEFSVLLAELENTITRINALDIEIAENTRQQDEIKASSDRLNDEDSALEQATSEFNQALDVLNADINSYRAQCDSQPLSNEALSQCESRRLRLENRNLELTDRSEQLTAREQRYSEQVNEINAREQARARAAQQLFIRRSDLLTTIDGIFQELLLINPVFQNCAVLVPNAMPACVQQVQAGPVLP